MRILIAGFEGKDNSAKVLLDYLKERINEDILYLKNDFEISRKQIEEKLIQNYDFVFIFGQIPNTKSIFLENNATLEGVKLTTDYCYDFLKEYLEKNNYKVVNSDDAGDWFCNNVFFRALHFKKENNLKTKICFLHIPTIDNIENIEGLSNILADYIKKEKIL